MKSIITIISRRINNNLFELNEIDRVLILMILVAFLFFFNFN